MTVGMVGQYPFYGGRFRREVRLAALALVVALVATATPRPGLEGRRLLILVLLLLATAVQIAAVLLPGRASGERTAVAALACGILAGVDPGTSAVFLVFVGLDMASSLALSRGIYTVALTLVATLVATLASSQHPVDAFYGCTVIGGYLLGATARQYVLRAEQAELRLADLERAEIERARAIQLAERANAAREIHDILAHSLGALVVELDAVNAVLDGPHPDLDAIRPVLRRAHEHAVDGLVEARQAVSSLRETAEPLEASLRRLVEGTATASLETAGTARLVPADVAVVVRRTAQEALTNATKHAPGSSPVVQLDFRPSSVVLTVTDGGRPQGVDPLPVATTGGGYGIEGMRERAELVGATLEAGPEGTGWRVALTVPDRYWNGDGDPTAGGTPS